MTNFHNERSLFPLQLAFYSLGLKPTDWLRLVVDQIGVRCCHRCVRLDDSMPTTTQADTQQRAYDNGQWELQLQVAMCRLVSTEDCGLRIADCIQLHKMRNCLARQTAHNVAKFGAAKWKMQANFSVFVFVSLGRLSLWPAQTGRLANWLTKIGQQLLLRLLHATKFQSLLSTLNCH